MQSIRPHEGFSQNEMDVANVADSDADDEFEEGDLKCEPNERIALPKEDEKVRRLPDPKLPSETDVDNHYVQGHLPYRSWCPVCVKAKGHGSLAG